MSTAPPEKTSAPLESLSAGEARTLAGLALSRSAIDRHDDRRLDADWLAARWADAGSRVFAVAGGEVHVTADGARLVLTGPQDAPEGRRYFLGADGDRAYFAVGVDVLPEAPAGAVTASLREVGGLLDDAEVGLLVHAVGLDNWHRVHRHCPRCGAATTISAAGHTRHCPVDGSEHYPRTDPAVIMAVIDADDRILLGHQARWPDKRFSTLAGFVEPGESLEHAVIREVAEESGIRVRHATYLGSQPWPMPASLMVGFLAEAESTAISTDEEEIAEAHWYTRAQLAAAVEAGEVLLPGRISIARRLIEHWYGGPLDGDDSWR